MPQHLLNAPYVSPVGKHGGCKGMSEGMGGKVPSATLRARIAAYYVPDSVFGKGKSLLAQENLFYGRSPL